ncbi:helix-turn-helix domain-containing protein [Pedobacter sp. GR22-6]|uniref:helix-turn-helix domain-containing protein n=1 Tax=Pedobacter sp. GR22-6 TaxID=3127957 RepID=UPI00307D8D37
MQEILSKKEIGERVKNLRLESKLSQSFVSEKLKISRSNYSQIELGNQFPSFNTLYLISSLYGKSYEWLLHGDETPAKAKPKPVVKDAVKDMQRTLMKFKSILSELEEEFNRIKRTTVKEIQEMESE